MIDQFTAIVLSRVDAILRDENCPWPITRREKALLVIMRSHVGKGNRVPLLQLARLLSVNPRKVKAAISNLRLNFGVLIGASRDADAGGYYLISSAAELDDSTRPLLDQALSELRTYRAMTGSEATAEALGQLRVQLEAN